MRTDILNEIEVKYTVSNKNYIHDKVVTSKYVFELAKQIWSSETICLFEEFKILYLNRSNRIIGFYPHSKGGISSTVADIRLIIGVALKCAASSIILIHNHPSGNLQPSEADIKLTAKINSCCKMFDLTLLDHLIITDCNYYSFADNGVF